MLREELRAADVAPVLAALARLHPYTWKNKDDSEVMDVVASFLGALKITDPEAFMRDFTTTIPLPGHKDPIVYVPFVPGEGTSSELIGQLEVFAHENVHVEQMERIGKAGFSTAYLVVQAARRRFEVEAYTVSLEVSFLLRGTLPWEEYTGFLKSYGLSSRQRGIAKKALEKAAHRIETGDIRSRQALMVLEVLKRIGRM